MKTKKIRKLIKYFLFTAFVATSLAGLCACKNESVKVIKFDCLESSMNVASRTVYELPKYYVTYSDGTVNLANITLSDKDENEIIISGGKFFVEQQIGEKYTAVYTAGTGKNAISRTIELIVTDDSAAPVLTLDKQTVCVAVGDYVSLKSYYTAWDDSGIEPKLEYTLTYNGETKIGDGNGFIAEEGVYAVDLQLRDSGGRISETKRLSVVSRYGNMIADFETEADVRDTGRETGVRVTGANMPVRSKNVVHGGNYSLYVNNNIGSSLVKVVPFNASGETNGETAIVGSIIGAWYYFLPKDNTGEINLTLTLAPDYVLNKLGEIEIYEDGAFFSKQGTVGSGSNGYSISLPTEKWVYVQCTVVAVDTNFYIGFTPEGYSDNKLQFYLDDVVFGLKSDLEKFNYEVDCGDEKSVYFNPSETINAFVTSKNVQYKRGEASYRLYKESESGNLRIVNAREDGTYTLEKGIYRAYLADKNNEYGGIYATVNVTRDVFASVKFDLKGNETLPNGVVNRKYPIPAVSAASGITMSVKAFVNYYGENATELNIENRSFLPENTGIYTIEYTFAKNSESKTVTYDVVILDSLDELTDDYDEFEKITFANVGEKYELKKLSVQGGSGAVHQTIRAITSDGEEVVALSKNEVVFDKAGVYEIVYEVSDYLETKTKKYAVTVVASELPIVEKEAVLPRTFNSGFSYSIEKLTGKLYEDNGSYEICELNSYWRYNGVEMKIVDGNFVPVVDNDGDEIIVIYKAIIGEEEKVVKEYVVSTIKSVADDKSKVNPLSLVALKNADATLTDDGIAFVSANNENEISLTRPVLLQNFSLHLSFTQSGLNKIVFTLTDCKNETQTITFFLYEKNEKVYAEFNGNIALVNGSFSGDNIVLRYNALYNALYDGKNNAVVNFENKANFSSGKVYLDMRMLGETDGTERTMTLRKINGQDVNSECVDYVAPETCIAEYQIANEKGTTFTLPDIIVSDLYDENPKVWLAVKKGNKTVVSTKGISLDYVQVSAYSFVLSETGSYNMIFMVEDCFGNSKTYQKTIWSIETDMNLIEVEGEREITAKVGDTISIPAYKVMLNENVTVYMYLSDEEGQYEKLSGNSFRAEKIGLHKIAYYAMDENGNVQIYHVRINVR